MSKNFVRMNRKSHLFAKYPCIYRNYDIMSATHLSELTDQNLFSFKYFRRSREMEETGTCIIFLLVKPYCFRGVSPFVKTKEESVKRNYDKARCNDRRLNYLRFLSRFLGLLIQMCKG